MKKVENLILGNGAAGLTAASAIREGMENSSILMISEQKQITYIRPLLSKAGFRQMGMESLEVKEPEWYDKMKIPLWLNCMVEKIDAKNHVVYTTRESIEYEACVYALGGRAFIPPVEGRELEGVFTVRNIEDAAAIKRYALRCRKAVVIGGGVIGIEISELLYKMGLEVTILENQPYILPRILDRETAEEYEKCLHRFYEVFTGTNIKRIDGEWCVKGVCVEYGEYIDCDMVIFSCGITPNIAIARAAGLETGRAVKVDDFMRTSDEAIFACGDCAEWRGENPALWNTAIEQGRTAGLSVCGQQRRYHGKENIILCNSSYAPLFAMGDLKGEEKGGCYAETYREEADISCMIMPHITKCYKRLVYKCGNLTGAALIGNLSEMEQLKSKMSGGEQ